MIKRLWVRVLCQIFGHRRGKLSGKIFDAATNIWHKAYYCPRCTATWHRQVKERTPQP